MSAPISKEILEKVELIRIITRKSVTSLFAGEFESAFKGEGLEFEEVREYLPGDEIRAIDWNVTAKTGYPHIKRFREERELSIFFVVDVSPSGEFGSSKKSRNEIAAEIVSLLSLSASMNNDKTGLILFTDHTELFIPLGKGLNHTLQMVRELLAFKPEKKGTSISSALNYLGKIANRRSIVFLISDFFDSEYEHQLKTASRKHDIVSLYLYDPIEKELPNAGLIELHDSETGESYTIDSSSKKVRIEYKKNFLHRFNFLKTLFRKNNCGFIDIDISKEYVHNLSNFFINRKKKQ